MPTIDNWLMYAALTLALWGSWGFLYKLADAHIATESVLFYSIVGATVSNIVVVAVIGAPELAATTGTIYAFLGGLVGALGGLTFLFAVQQGKVSIAVPLTALYPIVTVVLGVLVLGESLALRKVAGVMLALVAMVLLSL